MVSASFRDSGLHSLLASGNPDLRRSAAHALRGICDPSSASVLAEALNDNDPRIQYDALQGLAAMEDFPADRPAPATSDFNGDPPKYLNTWRSGGVQSGSKNMR